MVVATTLTIFLKRSNQVQELQSRRKDDWAFRKYQLSGQNHQDFQTPNRKPAELDYQWALFHAAAQIDGPLAGKEIGLRYTALTKDGPGPIAPEVGKEMSLRLFDWDTSVKTVSRSKATWQIFDDTDQDLLVPIFWVDAGPLAGSVCKINHPRSTTRK